MGKLSRGITFTPTDYVTQAKLHALIDTAIAAADGFPGTPTLYDIVFGDLLNCRPIHVAGTPASPATNDLAIGSDGKLDIYNGAAFQDLTTNVYPFINSHSTWTLVTGTPVVVDPAAAGSCTLNSTAGAWPDPLGLCQTVAGPGVTAMIAVRGIAFGLINNPTLVAIGGHVSIQNAGCTMLTGTSSVMSDVLGFAAWGDKTNPFNPCRVVQLVR